MCAGQLRFGRAHAGSVGALVDREQHVALLDQLALGKGNLVDIAADPRTQFHGFRRSHAAGEVAPQGGRLGQDFGHFHRGRRRRLVARFPNAASR